MPIPKIEKNSMEEKKLLGFGLHVWEQLMVWSLLLAAIPVVAVGITTAMVVKLQKAENESSAREFEKYKTEASEKIASSNATAETAKAEAAKANLELERLKAPRSLSGEQQVVIANATKQFATQEYTITTFWDEKEPLAFANAINQSLILAGWTYIKPGEGGSFLLGTLTGVQVWVHPGANAKVMAAANAFVIALNAVDASAVLMRQNPNNPVVNTINVNIGTKPQPGGP